MVFRHCKAECLMSLWKLTERLTMVTKTRVASYQLTTRATKYLLQDIRE